MAVMRKVKGLLPIIFILLLVGACIGGVKAYEGFQDRNACNAMVAEQGDIHDRATKAGIENWNRFRSDYERHEVGRAEAILDTRTAYLNGARSSYNREAELRGCPPW